MAAIFITGGTGYVGRSIVRTAVAHGHKMRVLIRSQKKAEKVLGGLSGVEFIPGDTFNRASLVEGMKGCDTVIHLAGIIVELPRKGVTYEKIHRQGTVSAVDAAKETGIKRYVHMSALGTRPGARSMYHKTKWAAEEYLRKSGLDYTIFRPSIIFGKEDAFSNLFASIIRKSPFVPLIGGGKNKLQPIWVEDIAEFFVQAVERKETVGKAYGLGGPDIFTMSELMDMILKVMGRRRIKLNMPIPLASLNASIFEKILETPPLTKDQLIMLQEDNICSEETLCDPALLTDFDIELKSVEEIISEYI